MYVCLYICMYVYMKCVLTNDFMRSASPDPVHLRVGLKGMTSGLLKVLAGYETHLVS